MINETTKLNKKALYEGHISMILRPDIPKEIINNLKKSSLDNGNNMFNEFKELNGCTFSLKRLFSSKTNYSDAIPGIINAVPYENTFLDANTSLDANNMIAYKLDLKVESDSFYESELENLINSLKPYMEKDTPNILGRIIRTDGKYAKTFYVYEYLIKDDIIEFIDNLSTLVNEDDFENSDCKSASEAVLDKVRKYIQRKRE